MLPFGDSICAICFACKRVIWELLVVGPNCSPAWLHCSPAWLHFWIGNNVKHHCLDMEEKFQQFPCLLPVRFGQENLSLFFHKISSKQHGHSEQWVALGDLISEYSYARKAVKHKALHFCKRSSEWNYHRQINIARKKQGLCRLEQTLKNV